MRESRPGWSWSPASFRVAISLIILCLVSWWVAPGAGNAAGDRKVLRSGDRGSEVLKLQQYLLSLGYDIELAGVFGPKTDAAVRQFQADFGLRVDGIVGESTWIKLEGLVATYTVRRGDTLWGIAREAGTNVETLRRLNGLKSDYIVVGQVLLLPQDRESEVVGEAETAATEQKKTDAAKGGQTQAVAAEAASEDPPDSGDVDAEFEDLPPLTHVVKAGETLTSIAREYGTTVAALLRVNQLPDPDKLKIGQELRLPLEVASRGMKVYPGSLLWPVTGRISSGYGPRAHPVTGHPDFHEGIDIAVPEGTPVRAAAGGKVVKAGWMDGYGYGVVIEHMDGIQTFYGHNSRVVVEPGQYVRRGEVIAYSGSTGLSTGPHVDFRVKVRGDYDDPLRWLR
ncbi:MAG: LysM peptidoglycan-binding domain-containing protein [Limnochordales bacterium]|nr:LysM peptidoglycan-binding domain-containing protein [Limnochordales bacterium]